MAFRSEPNLSFHRSKQSVAVRLSVTVVTREELKHSDMRGQFVEYLSTRDLRRESSLELHSFSDFLRESLSLTEAECSWKAKLDAEVLVLPSKSSEINQCLLESQNKFRINPPLALSSITRVLLSISAGKTGVCSIGNHPPSFHRLAG